jgi:hypothetical protein
MGLAWQQGLLAPGATGTFLVPEHFPRGCSTQSHCVVGWG